MSALLIARFDGYVEELTRSYVGVWDSEEHARSRWSSDELEKVLTSEGFPPPKSADLMILELHAIEPPL